MHRLSFPAGPACWLLDLSIEPPAGQLDMLSESERLHVERLQFERDRRRYRAAHIGLRQLLAEQTGVAAPELRFAHGPYGKPSLLPESAGRGCSFNLSHADDIALVALAPSGDIGIDVEILRLIPDAGLLASRVFSLSEQRELASTSPSTRSLAFLRGWTRKEACLKTLGVGLGRGLGIAPASFTSGLCEGALTTSIRGPQGDFVVEVRSTMAGRNAVCAIGTLLQTSGAELDHSQGGTSRFTTL